MADDETTWDEEPEGFGWKGGEVLISTIYTIY